MYPVLIKLGWFSIYAFGFMLALSFLLGIYIASYRAKRFGVNPQIILDVSVYVIVAGVVGSRLLYIVFHLGEYRSVVDAFALWQGGATLYGGLILAFTVAYAYARKKNQSFLQITDIFAPSLALGFMFTRVGCFMSGCCFGKPSSLPWAAVFPADTAAGYYARQNVTDVVEGAAAIGLHPTQLYESFLGLVIFVVLMLSQRSLLKRGATFGAFLFLYGVFRFTVDFFRYYEENMRLLEVFNWNQVLSVGFVVMGGYLVARKTQDRNVIAPK